MTYIYKHLVIVHGIGDQAPNETALEFMNEFIRALPGQEEGFSVDVHNLIADLEPAQTSSDTPRRQHTFRPSYFIFTDSRDPKNPIRHVIGFSEVFWRHIPDQYIDQNEGQLLIPIFTWSHSINTRFLEGGSDFHKAKDAINNFEKMIKMLSNLAMIYKKSGLLSEIITRFLGDVQVYAESHDIRQDINERFLSILARIETFSNRTEKELKRYSDHGDFKGFDRREIYIIAHSEGTVITFNSLVQAAMLKEGRIKHPEPEYERLFDYEDALVKGDKRVKAHGETARASHWLPMVKGVVTLGSPIDKHYTIWRNSFRQDHLQTPLEEKIPWFNYWDHSDPVGAGLKVVYRPDEDMQKNLPLGTTDAQKLFDIRYDAGFTRYPIPGLAHLEYWTDPAIYENIIDKVMGLGTTRGDTTVQSKGWAFLHRPLDYVAYAIVRGLTLAALLFFLIKLLGPVSDPLKEILPFTAITDFFSVDTPFWIYALWFLVPPLLANLFWLFYTRVRGGLATVLKGVRRLIVVGWIVVVLVLCLHLAQPAEGSAVTDWIGYLTGVVTTCLVWRLHTTIHKGIIQMWRYTKGTGSSAI